MDLNLNGKVAIITGGSRGIGFATVKAFLEVGATVVLTASREETAMKAVSKLKEWKPDAQVEGIWPELTDYYDMHAAIDKVGEKYGHIDILVNNAGVSENTSFDQYTPELMDKVLSLNVKGAFNCTTAVTPWMEKQGGGVVLNISSMVSLYGQPKGIAYPISKFAVDGMTLSLAREMGPKGIRVNAVAPGITETDMMKAVPKEVIEPMVAQIPLRRLGQPSDIANALRFLASDQASYITGVVLRVDGMARS